MTLYQQLCVISGEAGARATCFGQVPVQIVLKGRLPTSYCETMRSVLLPGRVWILQISPPTKPRLELRNPNTAEAVKKSIRLESALVRRARNK
jgi:hypothetical protein